MVMLMTAYASVDTVVDTLRLGAQDYLLKPLLIEDVLNSGIGKEVVARLIHTHGSQKERVFLPINCSAIPETLLESQLFGHTKGAFIGAVGTQEGLFQRARGGTIFLDEIGEMPLWKTPSRKSSQLLCFVYGTGVATA